MEVGRKRVRRVWSEVGRKRVRRVWSEVGRKRVRRVWSEVRLTTWWQWMFGVKS